MSRSELFALTIIYKQTNTEPNNEYNTKLMVRPNFSLSTSALREKK
jgi:hypothetical protein